MYLKFLLRTSPGKPRSGSKFWDPVESRSLPGIRTGIMIPKVEDFKTLQMKTI